MARELQENGAIIIEDAHEGLPVVHGRAQGYTAARVRCPNSLCAVPRQQQQQQQQRCSTSSQCTAGTWATQAQGRGNLLPADGGGGCAPPPCSPFRSLPPHAADRLPPTESYCPWFSRSAHFVCFSCCTSAACRSALRCSGGRTWAARPKPWSPSASHTACRVRRPAVGLVFNAEVQYADHVV